jgi:acyl-CoA synthetase (AMP-forming)/AMP-acid ligase II
VDPIRSIGLGDISRNSARTYGTRTAVVCRDHRSTYAQLDERVNRLANALAGEGVGEGDRLLWFGQNCHRVLETLLAAAKLGAMLCPINWRQSTDECRFVIDDLDPKVIIWQEEAMGDLVRQTMPSAGEKALWLQHDGEDSNSYEAFLATGSAEDPGLVVVDPALAVLVIYTAAYLGRPNGSMLTQANLLTQGLLLANFQRIHRDSVWLNCGPLFHIGCFMTAIPTFQFGGVNVFTRKAEPEELCRIIEAERVTIGYVLTPTAEKIAELNSDGRYDLSSFHSSVPTPGWRDMVAFDDTPWGHAPAGFGQTELTGLSCYAALGGKDGHMTAGRPSPVVEVRLVDTDGIEVPDGEVGEIVVRGAVVHAGYWNRDEINQERFRDGWWHTTDLGRREPDGVVSFIGTMTRMVKSAAENIFPAEVETCIESHPAVKEAAIIGVPDEKWIQSVKAIVVVQEGSHLTADEVIEHCKANLASFKKPRCVEFVEALPRQGFLKDYDALDARFGGGGYPGNGTRSR